jgi:hypothetical protein
MLKAVQNNTDKDVVPLAQSIRKIQEGTHTEADVERFIRARDAMGEEKLTEAVNKETVLTFPAKYKDEDIALFTEKAQKLRDYLMSHEDLKYGNEFNPQSLNALLRDLQEKGYPRSVEHDSIYKQVNDLYEALEPRIDEAYGTGAKVTDEPVDENGNPLF